MKRWISTLGALIAVSMVGFAPAMAAVTVTQIDYNGWAGAYKLTNGTVELVFVPQIGRIMRYGYVDGPNVLWNNPQLAGKMTDLASAAKEWPNYGGDKLWPAPQSVWNWPPDPDIDSALQTVKVLLDNHLRVGGQISSKYGIRFSREIALDDTGSGVTLKNTLANMGSQPVSWSIWEVAQMDNPTQMRLLLNKHGHFPTGYYVFKDAAPAPEDIDVTSTEVRLRRGAAKSVKIGSDAPQGYLEATVHDMTFRIGARVERGKNYPDDGCAEEIYTNPDPLRYVELEILSPMHTIAPGNTAAFTTHWTLIRR